MIGTMNIRTLALAPALLVAMAFPALADRIPLSEISRYLNSLTTVTSGFEAALPVFIGSDGASVVVGIAASMAR